jgi:transposase
MNYTQSTKQKESYLQDHGVLNPHPENVQDELFLANEFFDPRDLLQVRYEMIRRHRIDKASVKETSEQFGVSRVTFYQIAGLYDDLGLLGLVPQKPGPKSPTKCTQEVIEFVKQLRSQQPDITWKDIIYQVYEKFGVTLHHRTIEKRLASEKKKNQTQRNTQTFPFSKEVRP